jgi:hypothetical protein
MASTGILSANLPKRVIAGRRIGLDHLVFRRAKAALAPYTPKEPLLAFRRLSG